VSEKEEGEMEGETDRRKKHTEGTRQCERIKRE